MTPFSAHMAAISPMVGQVRRSGVYRGQALEQVAASVQENMWGLQLLG